MNGNNMNNLSGGTLVLFTIAVTLPTEQKILPAIDQ
jgi:hypothetical protein